MIIDTKKDPEKAKSVAEYLSGDLNRMMETLRNVDALRQRGYPIDEHIKNLLEETENGR